MTNMRESYEVLKQNISDLYDKDKGQTDERNALADKMNEQLTNIKNSISDVREKQSITIEQVKNLSKKQDELQNRTEQVYSEMEAHNSRQDAVTSKLIDALVKFNDNKTVAKWKPENIVGVLSALGGGAGIAALIMIFVK